MLQLSAAVASLTLVTVVGVRGLLGLGPAIVLASGALTALPAGRAMDRFGRVPVLARRLRRGRDRLLAGRARQRRGLARRPCSPGLLCVGAASGTALLARTAAGDMYPPERRAHGIALVLFGAVFGAILGPARVQPADLRATSSTAHGAGAAVAGGRRGSRSSRSSLVLAVRPDPQRIAELLRRIRSGAAWPAARRRRRCASSSAAPA